MATSLFFKAASAAILPSTTSPQVVYTGTNFPWIGLAYDGADDTGDNYACWVATMPDSYSGGELVARIYWVAEAAAVTGENVSWDIAVGGRIDGETWDAVLGSSTTVNDLVVAASKLHTTSATLLSPGLAAGDVVIIKVNRDYDEANGGTASGEKAQVVGIQLLES